MFENEVLSFGIMKLCATYKLKNKDKHFKKKILEMIP